MHFLFILLFLAFTSTLKSQQYQDKNTRNSYFISGNLKNAAGATIYLEENSSFKEINAIDSINTNATGNFIFKGRVKEPTLYFLRVKNKRGISTFILENSSIHISGNADSLGSVLVTGSKENDLFNKAIELPEIKQMDPIYASIFDAFVNTDTSALNRIRQQLHLFLPDLVVSIKRFILTYPKAYISVALLNNLIDIDSFFPDLHALDYADSLIDFFKPSAVSNHTQLNYLDNLVQSRLAVSMGKYAPEIFQPDTSGKQISLSALKGNTYYLIFGRVGVFHAEKKILVSKKHFQNIKTTLPYYLFHWMIANQIG